MAAAGLLRCFGWRVEGTLPAASSFVLVAAPHTSNWDAVIMLAAAGVLEIRLAWLGKRELFRGPLSPLLRWLGGVPVNRASAHGAAADAARVLAGNGRVALAIPPEGTRRWTPHWKMGFYLIARRVGVPIVLGFVDYRRRVAGLGPTIVPSGQLRADMELIRDFYQGVTARYPANVGEIQPEPRQTASA
jgi:1-acyl-sn-glycerol-3-phosphate acyltransferase